MLATLWGLPAHADGGARDAAPPTGADAAPPDARPPGVFLPGTQPGDLTKELREPGVCEPCHGGFGEHAPNDAWKGSMMANAARDPLFHAALTIANQDIPGSGDLCVRCHSPRGWLFGRSEPPRIDNLIASDFESVDCDFCHRLIASADGGAHIGTGQYQVADDFIRRGPISDALAPHEFEYSSYFEESRLCGLCHDVSNPLRDGFAIERTFTEWASSAFASENTTCQTCHLPAQRGTACGAPGMPEREVHKHELAGGNYWMPRVLAGEYPELDRADAYERTAQAAEGQLRRSADVTVDAPAWTLPGAALSVTVRVENKTGHKLPTGYPEGRRCWLELVVTDADGRELLHSGAYDVAEARRLDDPQLRTYEVRMAAAGREGFHFILQDELLEDTRIPPRGFVARDDTRPVGRDYSVQSADSGGAGVALAHWDEAPYRLDVPVDAKGPLRVVASLWYQTTSREYVSALRDENTTDGAGERLYALWEEYDRAPPFAMATVTAEVALGRPPDGGSAEAGAPDASVDAAASDAAPSDAGAAEAGGEPPGFAPSSCGCRLPARRTHDDSFLQGAAMALLLITLRSREKKK